VGLSLVVGPAHAGKVALLLDRFVEELGQDPWLVVPNRVEADRAERELVARCNGLLAGTIGTFDALFESLALASGDGRRLLGDAERHVLLRRVVDDASVPGSGHPGFADAVARTLAEVDGALVEPDDLPETSWSAATRGIAARSGVMRSGG
jgi:hypothetical protein